jgi:hypothetical protein
MKKYFSLVAGILIVIAATFMESKAQVIDLKSPYNLTSDTVTNTGTVFLTTRTFDTKISASTVQVVVTKISGTVGGTISLQGSLDGSNYKALNTAETQTALATITATDANNVYHWRLSGNPFVYYRVSWTGTGTMAASFTAQLLCR